MTARSLNDVPSATDEIDLHAVGVDGSGIRHLETMSGRVDTVSTSGAGSTEERIITAALECLAERGVVGVTMREVARTAGVAPQTLYNHFPDIGSIVERAVALHTDTAITRLEQSLLFVEEPVEMIRQLVREIAAINMAHVVDRGLIVSLGSDLGRFDMALDAHIGRALVAGVDGGAFRSDLDFEVDGALVRHMLDGVAALVGERPQEAQRIVAVACRTLVRALTEEVSA